MKAVQKVFHTNMSFPFEIEYRQRKNTDSPFHFHEWNEIVYVHEGEGTFFIDQSIQRMEKGDVFIIPGNTIHRAIPLEKTPYTITIIFFHTNLIDQRFVGDSFHLQYIFDESRRLRQYKYRSSRRDRMKIELFLETIITELREKQVGYRHAIINELQALLLYLTRHVTNFNKNESHTYVGPDWMKDVLREIEEKYTEDISLSYLAKRVNISSAHLSRVFKKMTGLNVSEYILTKKIVKAKELLLDADKKVIDVATQCGFESMPYFHRTFKKYTGMTPSMYRKQLKQ